MVLLVGWGMRPSEAVAQQLDRVDPDLLQQARADVHGEDLTGKDGPLSSVGLELALLYREHQQFLQSGADSFQPESVPQPASQSGTPSSANGQLRTQANVNGYISPVRGEMVVIDATARQSAASLKQNMQEVGAEGIARYKNLVSGTVPIEQIPELAAAPSLQSARMAHAEVKSKSPGPRLRAWMKRTAAGEASGPPPVPSKAPLPGEVISEGDAAMNTDDVRDSLSIDGAGVKVGVLSDSYNAADSAAGDIQSGDLPPEYRIEVLEDVSGTDEGRAMMQLIHDVAPGADLAFHTAFGGRANFAQGIVDLANAGADVTVDDIFYFAEPFFQDGPIAQAVNAVSNAGVPHFASAGNEAAQSYESDSWSTVSRPDGTPVYDFDPDSASVDTSQTVTVAPGLFGPARFIFQWDDPAASASSESPGADTDLDLELYNQDGELVAQSAFPNIGGDPVEVLQFTNPDGFNAADFELRIVKAGDGPTPGLIKYTYSLALPQEFLTNSSSSVGHNNATGGAGVAAASFADTPEFGTEPPEAEPFTSLGGTPYLFNVDGSRKSSPEVRDQPRFTGPDSTSTTVEGFDQFSGTSAAAPHVAALAALQKQADPSLSPGEIYTDLADGAVDMLPPTTPTPPGEPPAVSDPEGFDLLTGAGFVNADSTITSADGPPSIELATSGTVSFGQRFFDSDEGVLYDQPAATIEIVNTGNSELTVSNVSISGSAFAFASGEEITPGTLAPSERATGTLLFDPSSTGAFSETVTIESDAPDDGTVAVDASGEAILPPVAEVSADSLFEAVEAGSTATQTFTVANTGANPLEYDVFAEALGLGPFPPSDVAFPPSTQSRARTQAARSSMSVEGLSAPETQATDPPFSESDFIYTFDDGSAETNLGFGAEVDLFWLNAFQVQRGGTTITALGSAFSPFQPQESDVEFLLYEDPNDDGVPTDANLLETVSTTTEVAGGGNFQIEPIRPTRVEGVFFVAVLVPSTASFPAPLDESSEYQEASWIANADPGTFDTSDLSGSDTQAPPAPTGDVDFPGNWLLRAQGAYAAFEPVSDTVDAGGEDSVNITFDGTSLATGRYEANAAVSSNDPETPKVDVPFDFFVADAVEEASLNDASSSATFGDTGFEVVLENVSGSGTVTAMRFDNPPSNVDGLASDETASEYRWFVRQDGDLTFGENSSLRFLRADIPGPGFDASNASTINVYRRSSLGSGNFQLLSSTFDNGSGDGDLSDDAIVATGATEFSEFIFASDTAPLPVEVASLDATRDGDDIVLSWRTASETNNAGFRIERKGEGATDWTNLDPTIDGAGTTTEGETYEHRMQDVDPNLYTFRLKSVSTEGHEEVVGKTTIEVQMDQAYALSSVRPSPVSDRGRLTLRVREKQNVEVALYNVLGQKVRTLHDGTLEANSPHTLTVDGSSLASGVYLLQVRGDTFRATEKITLAR